MVQFAFGDTKKSSSINGRTAMTIESRERRRQRKTERKRELLHG